MYLENIHYSYYFIFLEYLNLRYEIELNKSELRKTYDISIKVLGEWCLNSCLLITNNKVIKRELNFEIISNFFFFNYLKMKKKINKKLNTIAENFQI